MGLRDNVRHTAAIVAFEIPSRRKDLDALYQQLETGGSNMLARMNTIADSDFNRRVLTHIIGIERWGQRRLKVTLGEPFLRDEYNDYRPPRVADWETLKSEFETTRAQTLALITQLQQVDFTRVKILHNFYGELSVRGWLRYLFVHALFESRKIR